MEDLDLENPLANLWRRNFAFGYWDNRIKKLNPYNRYDGMDSLYILAQLADLYAHLFAVNTRNPEQPWMMVKEDTYTYDITSVLDELTVEIDDGEMVSVSRLAEEPEGLIEFEQVIDEIDATDREMIAREFLGCSAVYDEETNELDFVEDPDLHIAAANAALNFWRGFRPLLNDLKHGFRVLPVTMADIEWLWEEGLFGQLDTEVEDLIDDMEAVQQDQWGFFFLRLQTEALGDRHYDAELNLYHVNSEVCKQMSKVILNLIYNLIMGREGGQTIAEPMSEAIEQSSSTDVYSIQTLEHIITMSLQVEEPM
ncbi:hypothetical protein Harman_36490 [Haloarcula mannanilytica]|uniref:Uncharacterized protein n=1 Tax=Haloarcula mannanilytica TaxID=2509225 RepID=A0A4C2EMA5_9EURY|nr:hypothetical protein [Haloarcula mannanilytica]GCF15714.1 hypothetical protein Harman_36490 [Haloarcula mannanilytica]